jgi:ABC-type multidrug transport system ATPase subunit
METTIGKKHSLKVDSVMISFGDLQLLSGVEMSCETGDIVGILGRNGCGKSTLLKIIFGTQHTFQKNIRIDNKPYEWPSQTGNQIAYLPQHGFLPGNLSLKRIVQLFIPCRNKRNNILNHHRIESIKQKTPHQLSGGERRFFEVLLLVHLDVKFVLLDEPFSGIEPQYKKLIGEIFDEFRKEKGFIITDHDYKSILEVADTIKLLKDGRFTDIRQNIQLEQHQYVPAGTFSITNQQIDVPDYTFNIDNQTLMDLDVWVHGQPGPIMELYCCAKSHGANSIIRKWMLNKTIKVAEILNRIKVLTYFKDHQLIFKYPVKKLEFIQHYLNAGIPLISENPIDLSLNAIKYSLRQSNDQYLLTGGIQELLNLIDLVASFLKQPTVMKAPCELKQIALKVSQVKQQVEQSHFKGSHTFSKAVHLHNYIQTKGRQDIEELIVAVYTLEALSEIAQLARNKNLNFADLDNGSNLNMHLKGIFHPLITSPVKNNISLDGNKHMCFLTGANMSGKSTFLKSVSLAIYLAHVGLPVPADSVRMSFFNGVLTTINLSDNIQQGYSHFYHEVKRVKQAAIEVNTSRRMLVVFDELFRGTNVKDAADASLMVSNALAEINDSICLISTHIIEIGDPLKQFTGVDFKNFSVEWKEGIPTYDYLLRDGISAERLGLHIVKTEGIFSILEAAKTKQ